MESSYGLVHDPCLTAVARTNLADDDQLQENPLPNRPRVRGRVAVIFSAILLSGWTSFSFVISGGQACRLPNQGLVGTANPATFTTGLRSAYPLCIQL